MPPNPRPLRRGDIYWVEWSPGRGSEQAGRRPSLIVQSNEINDVSGYPVTILLTISGGGHDDVPSHIPVAPSRQNGLTRDSYVRCEQILTASPQRLDGFIGTLDAPTMAKVDEALLRILGLRRPTS